MVVPVTGTGRDWSNTPGIAGAHRAVGGATTVCMNRQQGAVG
jgi:hypothetical protein